MIETRLELFGGEAEVDARALAVVDRLEDDVAVFEGDGHAGGAANDGLLVFGVVLAYPVVAGVLVLEAFEGGGEFVDELEVVLGVRLRQAFEGGIFLVTAMASDSSALSRILGVPPVRLISSRTAAMSRFSSTE